MQQRDTVLTPQQALKLTPHPMNLILTGTQFHIKNTAETKIKWKKLWILFPRRINKKSSIYETINSKFAKLEEVIEIKLKLNELDKYTTRTFLKFSGINEENTDNAIINILNRNGPQHRHIEDWSQSSRGPTIHGKPRDIIDSFLSYRDRDLVYTLPKRIWSLTIITRATTASVR